MDQQREAGCSLCGATVLNPDGVHIEQYPPDRWYQHLHRDPYDVVWVVRCHGCTLHARLLEIHAELAEARERAATQKQVALATWEREEERQQMLRDELETRSEAERADVFLRARFPRQIDEYQERIAGRFPTLTPPPSGAPAGPDSAHAVQSAAPAET